MSKISLKFKLSILLILISLLPVLTAGIFSYRVLLNTLEENTQKHEMSILENQMINFDLAMKNFETILIDLVTAESTQGFLQFRHEKESQIYYSDLLLLSSKVDSLMSQRGDAMEIVAFLWNDGDLPLLRGNSYGLDFSGDYTAREPFASFLQADASIHWEVVWENGIPAVYVYRTMYESSTNQNEGVALIKLSTAYFQDLLSRSIDDNAFHLLLDKEGNVVFAEDEMGKQIEVNGRMLKKEIEENVDQKSKTGSGIESAEGLRGVVPVSFDGKRYIVSYAASQINDWEYLYFNPITNMNKAIDAVAYIVLAVIVITSFLTLAAALGLYYYLSVPITELSRAMVHLRQGELNARVKIKRQDELGMLGFGFNQMAERIKQLISDIEMEQREKRRMEVRFLQAQITPHFLYNTLNSIKVLSRAERSGEAAEMTTALISLLRLSSSGNEIIPLSQELQYVENYMEIMSYRKSRTFHLVSRLEPGTEDCGIPKFSLQPFVENSIIHGFLDCSKERCLIEITSCLKENGVYVTIEDNGIGFEQRKIKKNKEEGSYFNHIGIQNVEERIKLYFGQEYGVNIESIPNEGTKVTLHLPQRNEFVK